VNMGPIDEQFEAIRELYQGATIGPLAGGSWLVRIPDVPLPAGWNRPMCTVLFVVPAGYPVSGLDCFWVESAGFRLANGGTPQASNDANPIPGAETPLNATWFSWHLQVPWRPGIDTLRTYFAVIMARLDPAR